MKHQLNTFQFGNNPVRVVLGDDGEPWWIAADVCAVLDLGNPTQALTRLDEDETGTLISNEGGAGRRTVNESGLYSLVLGSRKPEAKAFKKWITSEVLPSIRKTGAYNVTDFQVPKTLPEALRLAANLADEVEAKQATITMLEPKAAFHDAVSMAACTDAQSIGEAAKVLGTGQNRLFQWLRGQGLFIPGTTLPYQQYLDRGYFRVIEMPFEDAHGIDRLATKTLITGKGLTYIQRLMAS